MKSLLKILCILVITTITIIIGICIYQEKLNENNYFYLSLWNVKTREKVFTKDNVTIHLIGMIHIGERDFYEKITLEPRNSNKDQKIVTLAEGVTDKTQLNKNKTSFTYVDLSKITGLSPQVDFNKNFPNVINADLDYKDFTVEFREELNSLSIILEQFTKLLSKQLPFNEFEETMGDKNKITKSLHDSFYDEIIIKRNDNLWDHIKKQIDKETTTIIVPWGARHLSDIESRLLKEGFVQTKAKSYKAINLLSVGKKLAPIIKDISIEAYSFAKEKEIKSKTVK